MSIQAILAPLFVEVLLTFVVGFWLARLRTSELTGRAIRPQDIDLGQPNWPRRTMQVANSYRNQFELPVLFYLLTVLSIMTRHADLIFLLLAWVFVTLRVLQAWIYVTSNNLKYRAV